MLQFIKSACFFRLKITKNSINFLKVKEAWKNILSNRFCTFAHAPYPSTAMKLGHGLKKAELLAYPNPTPNPVDSAIYPLNNWAQAMITCFSN